MRLHRFYMEGTKTFSDKNVRPRELRVGEKFLIDDESQVHQIRKVFRLGAGDKIILFNGLGKEFVSKIENTKENIELIIEEEKEIPKIEKEIHVYLSCIRKERFEWAVEKLTELGVSSITPIETERTEHVHLNMERLRKITIEASEQCGRGDLPMVNPVESLQFIVDRIEGEIIVADFDGEPISSCNLSSVTYNLLVGPEGGWTETEREFFKSKNAKFISLGNLVLRAETASIVLTTLVSQEI